MAAIDRLNTVKNKYQQALDQITRQNLQATKPSAVTTGSTPSGAASKQGSTIYQDALAQPNLREMIRNGATEAELQERNDTGVAPQSYWDRQGKQNYTFWNAGRSTIGDYGIDDSNADTWRRAKALYDAGDVNGAMDLVNCLSAQGKFGGWYDEAGNYYGFAQGYQGGANASYLPVFGGNLIARDVDTTGTTIWLTPDGKALHLGEGNALSDTGDTWSRYKKSDIAEVQENQRNILEEGKKKAETYIPDLVASGVDVPREMYPHNNGYRPEFTADGSQLTGGGTYPAGSGIPQNLLLTEENKGTFTNLLGDGTPPPAPTPYEEAIAEADAAPQSTSSEPAQTPYMAALSEAPTFTDPYKERRDAALERAENMQFEFDPNTDPVWQAYRKQYLREGKRATEDTMGRYAAMTGGMPSTAAVTAASQAGDYYASQLSDKLPQVYQDAYNRFLQEYQRQLGISDQYAQFGNTEYNRWAESVLGQWNKDREFDYGRERDAVADSQWQQKFDYGKERDAVADSQWNQEFNEGTRRWDLNYQADQDNTAWERDTWNREFDENNRRWNLNYEADQAARESDAEKTAYQRAVAEAERKAAYGDMSGLEALGIDTSQAVTKEAAYADDGSTYKFSTNDALYFVQNAPNQSSMKGGDGSIWRKDEYGNVTIEKNGKTYRYGNQAVGEPMDALSALAAAGITSEGQAYSWLLAQGYSATSADKLAKYYGQMLGGNTGNTENTRNTPRTSNPPEEPVEEAQEDNGGKDYLINITSVDDIPADAGLANRTDENGFYVRGQYYTWEQFAPLVTNGYLRATLNKKNNRVTIDIPE
jgi:hypothetical protein